MNSESLRDEVRATAEDRPGVYRWLSANGRILYVGKSVRLRSRLLSYFREETGKTARLVSEAASVRWDYIPNEFAALFREMHLIRAWQPEYNVQHKRDRRYGFIKITREPAPRLVPASRALDDGARYYGPFGQGHGWATPSTNSRSPRACAIVPATPRSTSAIRSKCSAADAPPAASAPKPVPAPRPAPAVAPRRSTTPA